MAEIRVNATGGLKLYDADDSHYAQIVAGTITSNVDAITLGHDVVSIVDNLALTSDSSVLKFGADNDTTLTHTDGTGLTLNSTNKLTFGDAASYINQSSDGVLTIAGEATIDLTASTAVLVSNDLKLDSDSSVIGFGADNDTTLTHTDGTGLTLNSTNKLCFNDASQFIQGASATVLDINATDEIELNATAIDINGTADISGTTTLGGTLTVNAGAVFNEASADVDFRVETNGNANRFFVNGGDNTVLFGTTTTQTVGDTAAVQIFGTSKAESTLLITRQVAGDGDPALTFGKSRNASPGSFTIVQDNDMLGRIKFFGDDGNDMATQGAEIMARVNGTPGANDMPTELVFSTTADGAAAVTERLNITCDGRGLSQFTAKAWLTMYSYGGTAIRDSHNVSSIDDEGAGDTTVNFSNNMGNIYYTPCASISTNSSNGTVLVSAIGGQGVSPTSKTVSEFRFHTVGASDGTEYDLQETGVTFFGD